MSDMLTIGTSGLRTYGRALSTVSGNISNASNPDYVRRDLRMSELAVTSGASVYYKNPVFQSGVTINGVARASDPFLEAGVRLTGASLTSAETSARWASTTQDALNDGESGVGKALNRTFARAEELSAAPFDNVLRLQFIADINATISAFNNTAKSLTDTSEGIAQYAVQQVSTLNGALENLGKTNAALKAATEGSAQQASLLDQRDTALAVITERLDVSVQFAAKGTANISFGGEALVTAARTLPLSVSRATNGELSLSANGMVLVQPANGDLYGLFSSAATIAKRLESLDILANDYAGAVNDWHINGQTDSGSAGGPLLAISSGAASLTMISDDPDNLALGSSGIANGNILGFSDMEDAAGLSKNWNGLVNTQAITAATANDKLSAAASQFESARAARDSLSAVDLDREAADLIRLQQAYDASARVIQVARETIQSILAIF